MEHYIGLDVSMKRTFICILNEQGKIIHEGSEDTDPHLISDYLSKLRLEEITLGFESGSLTPYLLTGFKERAIDAICMDARKLKPILALKINKTDKNDARGIAEAIRSGMYTHVHCKPEESIQRAILLTAHLTQIRFCKRFEKLKNATSYQPRYRISIFQALKMDKAFAPFLVKLSTQHSLRLIGCDKNCLIFVIGHSQGENF